jgi:hypothetical protein
MTEARDVDVQFQAQQMAQLRAAIKATQDNISMAGETLQSLAVKAPITGQLSALDADLGAQPRSPCDADRLCNCGSRSARLTGAW